MKYKITKRLISYFSVVLLIFSVIVGVLFQALFKWHTANIHEQELKTRAISIADTLSQFKETSRRGRGMGGGYGAYLKFIDDIAMSKVWLVDEKAQRIEMGHHNSSLSYDSLPDGSEELINQIFKDNIVSSQQFSSLLGVHCVTVGVPVKNENGIYAALLLHSPIDGMEQAQKDGIVILLFCILAALLFAVALSVLLAHHFIKPLQTMSNAAEQIIKGNYTVHTGINQNDEIGVLANNIDELSLRLSEAESERKELDKMRQDFISNISHELRTPVTVIKGSLEVLNEGLVTKPNEVKEYFKQMLTDISQLQRLVNDLLEISRLQSTNFQIEKTKIDLTSVLSEAVRSMQRLAIQKSIIINLNKSEHLFPFFGDYGRIRQMFIIVIDNAIKFSLPDQTVDIKMEITKNECIVTICDYGTGIPKEDIPYIFDRFYKEQSNKNKSGSGLGLPIAKQIAIRHNIKIICTSELDKGTSFSFLFSNKQDNIC